MWSVVELSVVLMKKLEILLSKHMDFNVISSGTTCSFDERIGGFIRFDGRI